MSGLVSHVHLIRGPLIPASSMLGLENVHKHHYGRWANWV